MKIRGRAWNFGDNVNTDEIIPAKYLNISDAEELAKHCMAGIDQGFCARVRKGDIIIAGRNFGCGSSREHAPLSIKACGVSCVIARSFARIFFRNSINIGLPILECREADKIKQGDTVSIDLAKGVIEDLTRKKIYETAPFPAFMQGIVDAGGLMNYTAKKMQKSNCKLSLRDSRILSR